MLQQKVFLGSLQLTISSPCEVNWHKEEHAFFSPVLWVKKQVEVNVSFCEELPEPVGGLIHHTNSMDIYKAEVEERYYYPVYTCDQSAAVCSRYAGNEIYTEYVEGRGLWYNPNFYLLTCVHLEQLLLDVGALVLHSCYTEYRGEAILFTAPSGTGKTTQAELWKRLYGSRIVNGDKCLLQKTDEGFFACGFFLHGSAEECENRAMPIRAIVVVRQSERNYVEELNAVQKVGLLYSEVTANSWNKKGVERTMELLEELIMRTPVMMLHCTMQDAAADILYAYLYGGK